MQAGQDEGGDLLALLESAFDAADEQEVVAAGAEAALPSPPAAKRQCLGGCAAAPAVHPPTPRPPAGPAAAAAAEAQAAPASHASVTAPQSAGAQQLGTAVADVAAASPLAALSDMLVLRVLANLSPEDLLVLAQTSRYFHAAASDASLWRRLYHARWPDGPQQEDAEHVQGSSWKLLYLERDQQMVLEARQAAPSEVLLPIYLQMATARRSEALTASDVECLFRSPAKNNRSLQLSSKVDAFRRQRGLLDAGKHARHGCQGGCSWAQLEDNAWICEKSGFVHVCDSECAFREPDPSSDLQVCTISGRCFANMLTDAEEHAGEQERGLSRRGGEEEGWGADDGISGRLGRAFYAGYNADTPEDFFRSFGVRF